jgi:hypothetical protein
MPVGGLESSGEPQPVRAQYEQSRNGARHDVADAKGDYMSVDADTHYSTYRERLIEHIFVGEVLRELWLSGISRVEILRPETDAAGYDVVIECNSVVRHIQLKATKEKGKRASVGVNVGLFEKPSGCVVWIYFDPKALKLGPFLWFGDRPGKKLLMLPEFKIGRHTKGDSKGYKAERPNVRIVPKKNFQRVNSVAQLVVHLFGDNQQRGGSL